MSPSVPLQMLPLRCFPKYVLLLAGFAALRTHLWVMHDKETSRAI